MGALFTLIGGGKLIDAATAILNALVEFFKTPVGQVVGLGLLLIGAYVGGKTVEHHQLTIKHKAEIAALNAAWQQREKDAAAKYETARQKRDAEIAKQIRAENDQKLTDAKAVADDLDNQLKALKDERAKTPAAYRLSDDDIARILRVHAGGKQPAPSAVNRATQDRGRRDRRLPPPRPAGQGAGAPAR